MKKDILGEYSELIDPSKDEKEWYNPELVVLKEKNGSIYSIQEVTKYYSEKAYCYYYVFHCLYGRNALNFSSRDYEDIKKQIDITDEDLIIDDFRPRERVVKNVDLWLVSKSRYLDNRE